MTDFHFIRPSAFFLLIPLSLLVIALFFRKKRVGVWSKVVAKHLIPHVLQGESRYSYFSAIFVFIFGFLLVTALAGPTFEKSLIPIVSARSGLVVGLDLSYAMDAQDLKPSRLQRAIFKINDILDKRKEGMTALLVYTEDAFVVTPMTDDSKTIKALLSSLDTSIMPVKGLNHQRAVDKGLELLKQAGITNGSMLLITAESFNTTALHSEVPVSILGVGTEEGAPIPKKGGGFYLDEKGTVLISKLNSQMLKKLARSTKGQYITLTSDDRDIQQLISGFDESGDTSHEKGMMHMKWHDQGYWVVLLTLPLAAFLLRRGALAFILIFMALPAQAFWKTADQKGVALFEEQDYEGAANTFLDARWKAASHYKSKNYEEAEAFYKNDKTADGYYNFGNALAMQGKYKEALAAYEKTLEVEPDHEDALHNKKVIEDLKQQNDQNEQSDKGDQKNDKNGDSQDNNGSDDDGDSKNDQAQDESECDDDQSEDKRPDGQNKESDQQDNEDEDDEESSQDRNSQQYRDEVDEELENEEADSEKIDEGDEEEEEDPQRQIDDRWLQKIPDDPGGLLRRKFLYQYNKQKGRT